MKYQVFSKKYTTLSRFVLFDNILLVEIKLCKKKVNIKRYKRRLYHYHFQTRNGVMKFSHTGDICRWGSVTFNIVQHSIK